MKKVMLAGAALITMLAGAAMAYHDDVDVLMMDLQPDVGIYELSLTPDGADVLAEYDVVPDGLMGAAIATFQTVSLTEPMAVRGGASDQMVDDAMRLWRARTVDAFTVSPDLLI